MPRREHPRRICSRAASRAAMSPSECSTKVCGSPPGSTHRQAAHDRCARRRRSATERSGGNLCRQGETDDRRCGPDRGGRSRLSQGEFGHRRKNAAAPTRQWHMLPVDATTRANAGQLAVKYGEIFRCASERTDGKESEARCAPAMASLASRCPARSADRRPSSCGHPQNESLGLDAALQGEGVVGRGADGSSDGWKHSGCFTRHRPRSAARKAMASRPETHRFTQPDGLRERHRGAPSRTKRRAVRGPDAACLERQLARSPTRLEAAS